MTSILTPLDFSAATAVDKRLFRKRVLPIDSIDYDGRKIDFTKEYLQSIVTSFNSGAYDNVPLQFADANNGHTNDPERYRGDVVAMAIEDDGLYVTVSATPDGAKVLSENSKLGISARIVNGYERSDGKRFDAAVQHVLATHDPRIAGLGPWSSVESFSNPDGSDTIDLTAEKFGIKDEAVPDKDNKDGAFSADELTKLRTLLAELDADSGDEGNDGGDGTGDSADSALTDAELATLLAEVDAEADAEVNTPEIKVPVAAGADLSNANEALELANQNAIELSRVRGELDEARWSAEREKFIKDYGFTPKIMELAEPALKGDGQVINLSNGQSTDTGKVMRSVLTEVGKMVKLLDLSNELGSNVEGAPDNNADAVARRDETTKAIKSMMGN